MHSINYKLNTSGSSEVMAFRWPLWSSVNKRGTQRAQTFLYPKLSIISCTALCPNPSVRAIVSTVTRLSSWMISSTLSLLRSVEAVRGRPLRGWSWMLVFPSLKRFTHLRTLLTPPCTHFHKHTEVSGEFLQKGFPLQREIWWKHACKTTYCGRSFC